MGFRISFLFGMALLSPLIFAGEEADTSKKRVIITDQYPLKLVQDPEPIRTCWKMPQASEEAIDYETVVSYPESAGVWKISASLQYRMTKVAIYLWVAFNQETGEFKEFEKARETHYSKLFTSQPYYNRNAALRMHGDLVARDPKKAAINDVLEQVRRYRASTVNLICE